MALVSRTPHRRDGPPEAPASRAAIEYRVGAYLAAAIAVIALCFNFVGGNTMAYLVMLLALIAILWSLGWRAPLWRLRGAPARQMFLAAFLLLALAFACSARQVSDVRYAGNFLMFLAFVPLSTFFERFAGPRHLGWVAVLALGGAVLSLLFALFEAVVLKHPRALGFGSDPIWSAEAAIVVGFIAAIGYLAEAPPLPAPVFLLGPALATLTTFLTGSRGPLLAAPVLGTILLVMAGRRARRPVLVLVLATIVLLVALYVAWPPAAERFATIAVNLRNVLLTGTSADGSTSARVAFWHAGMAAFVAAPLFGYGWGHFREAAYAFLPDHGRAFEAGADGLSGNLHLHADLLDLGVAAGLLGLCAYGLVIAAPIVGAWRSPRDAQFAGRRLGATLLAAGYFVCGLTYLMFGFEFHTTLYVTLAAILTGYCRDVPLQRMPRVLPDAGPPTPPP